jgi:hypothetical protein
MITKNENFKIPLSGEECSIGLVNITILLLNLRGWEIVEAETGNAEDATVVGLIICNTNRCQPRCCHRLSEKRAPHNTRCMGIGGRTDPR